MGFYAVLDLTYHRERARLGFPGCPTGHPGKPKLRSATVAIAPSDV